MSSPRIHASQNARSNGSEISYPHAAPPEPGTPFLVADSVHWLRMPLPFVLNHINLWLLEGASDWTVVDTGLYHKDVRALWAPLLAARDGNRSGARPIGRMLVTHYHPDHFGCAGWLQRETGAPLLMTHTEWLTGSMLYYDTEGHTADAQIELYRRHGLGQEWIRGLKGRGNSYRHIISQPPTGHHRIHDADVLTLGDRDWRVIVGTGHAPEHACLYCESLGVLIAGDQVLPRISPNVTVWASEPEANPLRDYLSSLVRLRGLPPDTLVLPSHGLPFRGLHARIDALREHHEERLEQLVEACREPRAAANLLSVLFRRELDLHQIMFAMGECLSHLTYLRDAGRLRCVEREDGTIRYVSLVGE